MSNTTDTAPAAETEIAAPASISEIIAGRSDALHDGHKEVGAEPVAPEPAPAPAPPAPVAAAKPEPAPDADPATDPKSPRWYREHMQKTNRELTELRARVANPAPVQPQPHPQPTRAPLPNPAEDPQGYHEAVTRGFTQQMQDFALQTTLSLSERFARQQHGGEAFEDCKAWLTTRPDLEAYFIQQPDPWMAAFQHYSRERLAEEIGDDPAAYRTRIEQEIRAKLEAEMAGREIPQPAPAPQMRSAPPAPASTARSAAPRDPAGRFTGPAPIGSLSKHRFG